MPIKGYGVWVGYPISYEAQRGEQDSSPHISLYYDTNKDASKGSERAAINVKSTSGDSRLAYWFNRNFSNPITDELQSLDPGFKALPSSEKGGLDYIRGNLMDLNQGTLLQHDVSGPNNDIIDYMSPILDQSISQKATIYLFGQSFPGGIHDVHMNQGNEGSFKRDNGVYQDGGIILQFPDGHWEAVFLAFAIQKVHTDDKTGNPIAGSTDFATLLTGHMTPPDSDSGDADQAGGQTQNDEGAPARPTKPHLDGAVFIKAALINPAGADGNGNRAEIVYLNNRTSSSISLDGWTIVNRQGHAQKLQGSLRPLSDRAVHVPHAPLSNKGGIITLLNDEGLKVDGVSYTAAQARREGNFLYFH